MKIEKIKPIPKYILERIRKLDSEVHLQDGHTRYYSYLSKNEGELCKVTVAVKCHKGNWYCKQCIVHGVHSERGFVKDMKFNYVGGYSTGFHDLGLYKNPEWYEDGLWYEEESFSFTPFSRTVNTEYLSKFPEYKYSAYEHYTGDDILAYIRSYEKYPQLEYILKMGLSWYCYSIQLVKKASKDKRFRKWLYANREQLREKRFDIPAIMRAYKKNISLDEAQTYENLRKDKDLRPILKMLGDDYKKYFLYVEKQGISHRLYLDYLNACNYLGVNMVESKNRYPHDFMRWHDIRIDEEASARAKQDRKERREHYKKFKNVAEKYTPMQSSAEGDFIIFIAKSPAELKKEGSKLHHCVGSYGYDQKFVREESLIFFVRLPSEPDTPFVTVEYSLEQRKVLQCYADRNQKPPEEVTEYINAIWLPYATKALKKIMKAGAEQ